MIGAGQTNIPSTAYRDVGATDLRDEHLSAICKAHVFDETFSVNSAFNTEVFVAAPHAVAMEFNLFSKREGCGAISRFFCQNTEIPIG